MSPYRILSFIFCLTGAALTLMCVSAAPAQPGEARPKDAPVRVSALSPADSRHLLQDDFALVKTVQAIPKTVLTGLLGEGAREGMADAGRPFEVSDAVGPKPLPFRRLVFAGVSAGYCLVYHEFGGIAHGTQVSLYRLSAGRAALVWKANLRSADDSLSLPQLRREIRRGRFSSLPLPQEARKS